MADRPADLNPTPNAVAAEILIRSAGFTTRYHTLDGRTITVLPRGTALDVLCLLKHVLGTTSPDADTVRPVAEELERALGVY